MGVADFAFYMFALTVVAAGLFTVIARNPVHSVLWLILAFLSSAGLFVLLGAEFVAMLLIIVYVGAVAVLFLFVVMMLDVDFAELKAEMAKYVPLAVLIGIVLLMQLGLVLGAWVYSDAAQGLRAAVAPDPAAVHNTAALGRLLYDDYILLFQLAGLILLVAMIGAIVLTVRHRPDIKRQDILAQMYRDPAKAMELKDVKPGQGAVRLLAALSVLALTAGAVLAQPDCTDANGTAYEGVSHYGDGIVLAWVSGDGTPFTMVAACGARRLVHIEMYPDMAPPLLEPYLSGAEQFTLAQLAQEMSARGYYVETGPLNPGACVCSDAILARHRVRS